jgi:cytochrome bd ubiquinol oxidase subunit I
MDPVALARLQFGLTVAFHFLFPPISIGLAWVIVFMGWKGLRTGEPVYEQMTHFWVKILAIIFAVGVATGITMEFQFGTNWSTYSRFVGDIFGSPLAAEGIFAFFLESVFMGVLILGRSRVSKKFYWFSSLMVALGTTLSAFWIIVANSWQQTPAAYQIVGEGAFRRAELTNFWLAVFNPSTVPRYLHTVVSSVFTGSFFIVSISAWFLLKGRHMEFARKSFRISLVTAAIFSVLILGVGHAHALQVAETQPAKMAAFEALFETEAGAPMVIFGFPDAANERLVLPIRIPKLLSFMIHNDFDATVIGLDQFPREEWPPLAATFYPYHFMFLLGFFFIGITWLGVLLGQKTLGNRLLLRVYLLALPLPLLSMQLGWMAAEFGRQPWVVYNLLKTRDAVSVVVPAGQILLTIILFGIVYALLGALTIFLVRREVMHGPRPIESHVITSAPKEATT